MLNILERIKMEKSTFKKPGNTAIKILLLILSIMILISCESRKNRLIIFYAPFFEPVFNALNAGSCIDPKLQIAKESGGNQILCRKINDLGRECDLAILAESSLFNKLLSRQTSWKIDFACDEMVLGVGIRANFVDDAESNWAETLMNKSVTLGRVNESTGPVGFRTLILWKLKEKQGFPGLSGELENKCTKITDDVGNLASLLKNGTIDYAFLYRTTCLAHDIRYIRLDDSINLGDPSGDYSSIKIELNNHKDSNDGSYTVYGTPITYSLSIMNNAANRDNAVEYIKCILKNKKILEDLGYRAIKPRFYGSTDQYRTFSGLCEYAGKF